MALIKRADLRQYVSVRKAKIQLGDARQELIKEAKSFTPQRTYDVFLSHSYADAKIDSEALLGLKYKLEERGVSVYVDWIEDAALDRTKVNVATASTLKTRMRSCKSLLFAVSANIAHSKWMPWELGFFDGSQKPVAIAPLVDQYQLMFAGQEYLGLYPYVSEERAKSGEMMLYVETEPATYTTLSDWLKGVVPSPQ